MQSLQPQRAMVGPPPFGPYDGEVRHKSWPPVPPFEPPPARTLVVDGVGELFVRDSGGSGPPVMLLHGWTASADLNWWACYRDLQDAGYRVLAIDHRGHGRGLRTYDPFTLTACAADPPRRSRRWTARPRPSLVIRWEARSRSWSRAIIPMRSPASCSARPPSTGRIRDCGVTGAPCGHSASPLP